MKYMGSKARIAKYLLPIILKNRSEGQYFVDLFTGGCNLIDKVDGNRIANDINFYLIEMWKKLLSGWVPEKVTREFYNKVRANPEAFDACVTGWVGFNCSYSGKWFGGYAGETKTKEGTVRDYQKEALKNVISQVENLKDVSFLNEKYYNVPIPDRSIIYCDIPYFGTTGYGLNFDHDYFFRWVRMMSLKGHSIFISEYSAPPDFDCLIEIPLKSSLSANGKAGGSKNSIEKLFKYKFE